MLSVSCRYLASLIADDARNDRRLGIEESRVDSMDIAMTPTKMKRILRRLYSELLRIANVYSIAGHSAS